MKDCAKLANAACDAGDGSCAKFAFPEGIADYCGFNDFSDLLLYLVFNLKDPPTECRQRGLLKNGEPFIQAGN
jgi:hypothetical protein